MTLGSFCGRYKAAIVFNRNLIISGIAGFFISAYVSQEYSKYQQHDLANAAIALATEYAVYLPLFGTLFYLDNRQKYIDQSTGKRNSSQIRADLRKLIASFGVSEVVFSIVRFGSQYALLSNELAAFQASMASSVVAWAVFFFSINVMAKLTRLHQEK